MDDIIPWKMQKKNLLKKYSNFKIKIVRYLGAKSPSRNQHL